MSIDVIFLGLDGVLFDTEALHLAACNAAFADSELSLRWTLPALRAAARTHGSARAIGAALIGEPLSRNRENVARLFAAKHRHFHQAVMARPPRASNACMTLIADALHAGCKLSVLTDLPAPVTSLLLEQCYGADVNSIFTVVAGDQNFDSPGALGPYARAMHAMSLEPAAGIVIDAAAPALRAAHTNGLWSVSTAAFGPQAVGQPFITFEALRDLKRSPFALNRSEAGELAA